MTNKAKATRNIWPYGERSSIWFTFLLSLLRPCTKGREKTLVWPYHKYGRSVLPHNDSDQQCHPSFKRNTSVVQLMTYFEILFVFVKRELIFLFLIMLFRDAINLWDYILVASVTDEWQCMNHGWNVTDRVKQEDPQEILSHCLRSPQIPPGLT
jgi:hypothetical protein